MSRWFWHLYWPAVAMAGIAFILGPVFGPQAEIAFAPIRGSQNITAIERKTDRLCWTWSFEKLRSGSSNNLDAFLEVNGQEGGVVAPYERESGRPWGIVKYAVPPRAEPYRLDYCIGLPPYVRADDQVRIRQTAFYSGWLGLWRLEVPFPDVVSEGASPG